SAGPFPVGSVSGDAGQQFKWVPTYPDAPLGDIHTRRTRNEVDYGFEYSTKNDMAQVVAFYTDRLRASGFTVTHMPKGDTEQDVHAESPDRKRQLDATVVKTPQLTVVSVAALER